MPGFRSIAMAACLWAVASPAPAQPPSQPPGSGTIRDVVITGVRELGENVVRGAIPVQTGAPTSDSLKHIAEAVERRYRDEGYSFAHVTPVFDEASGTLSLTIDEGIIDGVEFHGIDDASLVRTFLDEFALRAADVFNRTRAMQALEALLQQTRGAVRPGRLSVSDSGG